MLMRLLWNEIKNHKLLSVSTVMFMAVSSMLIILSATLFTDLLGSVNGLMEVAGTPDYLQMHSGEMDKKRVESFAEEHSEIDDWQVCSFLNLENNIVVLGESSLADNTQDNGLCIQGEKFDNLVDMNNNFPVVKEGEVYVPACYRSMYDLHTGDKMHIKDQELTIAGFIRDSQMNSMMASSKRFLVTETDYVRMKKYGDEEYLIEFLLKENTDTDAFNAEYKKAGLFANGPTITKPLIRMMNALSDGIMIFVILVVGIAILLISMLCIRFITSLGVERDRKEAGMLKALGIENRSVRHLYFSKYIMFSLAGSLIGFGGAWMIKQPLSEKLTELYGSSDSGLFSVTIGIFACILVQVLILLSIRRILKRIEKVSVMDALFSVQTQRKKAEIGQYVILGLVAAACMALTLIPQNLHTTLASPEFVTYMGIGDAQIRMDVRQSENIPELTQELSDELSLDSAVTNHTVLKTVSCPTYTKEGDQVNLLVETGDHSVFPVTYAEGRQPERAGEIALSGLQAQDLGLEIGDTLEIDCDGRKITAEVCGIYSDITNGGKTAKMRELPPDLLKDDNIMWSILYVSLKDDSMQDQWAEKYQRNGVSVVDIEDYVQETYGPTINQVEKAKLIALAIAVLIVFVVLVLFMRLMIERKRYSISFQKALGFGTGSIRRLYFIKGYIPVSVGALTGVLLSVIFGEGICGQALKSFGAYGFHFVIHPIQVVLIVLIFIGVGAVSVCLGTWEVKNIKAYECCMRRD